MCKIPSLHNETLNLLLRFYHIHIISGNQLLDNFIHFKEFKQNKKVYATVFIKNWIKTFKKAVNESFIIFDQICIEISTKL